jgi:hypothetical protein
MARRLVTEQPQTTTQGDSLFPGMSNEDLERELLQRVIINPGAKGSGTLLTALNRVSPKKSESEKKLEQQKSRTSIMNRELDSMLKDWEKVPLWQRLPIPGIKTISPERSKYESNRDLYNYMLITMVADKRITDAERNYFAKQFPSMLMPKSVAKTKIKSIKQFISAFNETAPTQETANGIINIDELWNNN